MDLSSALGEIGFSLSSYMDTFANRIATALTARGMKPTDLVRQKVLSKAGVYFLLDGTTKPDKVSAVTVSKLCKALSVDWQWLLHGRGSMGEAGSASQRARIDPDKLALAIAALRRVAERNGYEYDPQTHPVETIAAYQAALIAGSDPNAMIDFGSRVAELIQPHRGSDAESTGGDREAVTPHRKRIRKKTG